MEDSIGKTIHGLSLITLRQPHHAGPSGYDRLASVLPGELIPSDIPESFAGMLLAKVAHRTMAARSGTAWYGRLGCMSELKAAARWARVRNHIFHFLYGENCYRYLGNLKRVLPRNNRVIATYHMPDWKIREGYHVTKHLRQLDAIVVVSTSQIGYFAEFVENERIHFVPHGVDTDYFVPKERRERQGPPRFLMVGAHLRDFESFLAVTRAVWKERPDVIFEVVARPKRVHLYKGLPNVVCLSEVSDDELRDAYQRADVLLLPLLDSTANNTLLEGMASGLAVISTDLAGIRDYASTDGCVLTRKADVAGLTDAVLAACSGSLDIGKMGVANRSRALDFEWRCVGKTMLETYHRIVAQTG